MVLIGGAGPTPWLYDDRLRLNGVKLYVDGALGSRGAALKAPYADDPGNTGLAPCRTTSSQHDEPRGDGRLPGRDPRDRRCRQCRRARRDRASFPRPTKATVAGASSMPRWSIRRTSRGFGSTASSLSMQPVHQTSDRLMAEARLGPAGWPAPMPGARLRPPARPLAFGSDAPVEAPDPSPGLLAAMTRQDADGQPFGGWQAAGASSHAKRRSPPIPPARAWAGFRRGPLRPPGSGPARRLPGVDGDPLAGDRGRVARHRRCWKLGSAGSLYEGRLICRGNSTSD